MLGISGGYPPAPGLGGPMSPVGLAPQGYPAPPGAFRPPPRADLRYDPRYDMRYDMRYDSRARSQSPGLHSPRFDEESWNKRYNVIVNNRKARETEYQLRQARETV